MPPDEDLLDFSEVVSSSSSSFPFALLDSGSAVHTAPSSSFLTDPISSLAPIGTQLTAAKGTSIPSTNIISGEISSTLPLDYLMMMLLSAYSCEHIFYHCLNLMRSTTISKAKFTLSQLEQALGMLLLPRLCGHIMMFSTKN